MGLAWDLDSELEILHYTIDKTHLLRFHPLRRGAQSHNRMHSLGVTVQA